MSLIAIFCLGLGLGALLGFCVLAWLVLTSRAHRLAQVNGPAAIDLAAAAIRAELVGGPPQYATWDGLYRGVALAALRAAWPELARPYVNGYMLSGTPGRQAMLARSRAQ